MYFIDELDGDMFLVVKLYFAITLEVALSLLFHHSLALFVKRQISVPYFKIIVIFKLVGQDRGT